MAGGMIPGRSGRNLGERAANSGVTPPPLYRPMSSAPASTAQAASDGREGRHCWVHDPPDSPGIWPGLLVEWRQHTDGWQGRVAYTVTGPHGPALVETWLPAARLEPR
jgi:hypothetical protein